MPAEMILSKLSSEALGKAVTKSEGAVSPIQPQGSSFKDILAQVDTGQSFAESLGIGDATIDPTGKMQSLTGSGINFKPGEEAIGVGKPDTSQKVVDLLGEVNKGQMQMDSMVNQILYSGKKFSNQELLCIQAHVFHFAQMTELTVKVAEQGVSSMKSVLNTQVQ
jgi:hypothetical protein